MDGAFFREKGPLSAGGELNHNNGSGTIHPGFYPYAATVSVSYASADRKPESGAANLRCKEGIEDASSNRLRNTWAAV